MTAPELRSFVRSVLDELDDDHRSRVVDSLVERAARGAAGWKPSRPSRGIVEETTQLAEAARRIGYADPEDVTSLLRQGSRAFLAGDHARARAVFEALLPPIAHGDIDLGQHELVDDVLNVDARLVVAQYVTSVYTTMPLGERANAVYDAIEQVEGFASLGNPIEDMEGVTAGALPDLGAFLPRWAKRLERLRPSKDDWEGAHERWLREAVFRTEGVDGLERIARKTKRPQACLAWCAALIDRGDWSGAHSAYDTAAKLVGESPWRGELLDGAALAAQQLGRPDVGQRLEAAWLGVPTLMRLVRWLVAAHPSHTPAIQAKKALRRCPKTAGRQLGLLHVLVGDLDTAAKLLGEAPGLGWSSADHPGHVLFPVFAILLADGTSRKISATLLANLESTCLDPVEMLRRDGVETKPALAMPPIGALIDDVRPELTLETTDRDAILDAMRAAAEKRVEAILSHSRRRHYGHAAMLVASCLRLAPTNREETTSAWIAQLRAAHSRRHAFKEELRAALNSLGLNSAD